MEEAINEKMTSIIYNVFNNNNLLETIKQNYKKSDLIISVDIDSNDTTIMKLHDGLKES